MKKIVFYIPIIIMFLTGCNKVNSAGDIKTPCVDPGTGFNFDAFRRFCILRKNKNHHSFHGS